MSNLTRAVGIWVVWELRWEEPATSPLCLYLDGFKVSE